MFLNNGGRGKGIFVIYYINDSISYKTFTNLPNIDFAFW